MRGPDHLREHEEKRDLRAKPEYVSEALEGYLRGKFPEREGLRVSNVDEITSGWETELYSLDLDYTESGRAVNDRLVARLYPGKSAESKAEREYRAMRGLLHAGYPVPEVFSVETDAGVLGKPFVLMERIEGRTMEEVIRRGSGQDRERMLGLLVRLLVELHGLDLSLVFPGMGGTTMTSYIEGVLDWSRRRAEGSGVGWLGPVIGWLDERKGGVSPVEPSVIHKDFHPMNIILREDGSPVVIDWGASTVGDRRDDLAWTVLLSSTFWDPSLRETILGLYESASGRGVLGFEYFEVLSALRRLTDVSVSLERGAEKMGMREGAVEMMRGASGHLQGVYGILRGRTGLRLPGLERLLESL